MSFFSSVLKITKSIVKSPITQAVVGGAAIVFPPAGLPAAAAIATANMALGYAESPQGKAVIGLADKGAAAITSKKKAKVKIALRATATKQLRAGVPAAKVKATMRVNANRAAVALKLPSPALRQATGVAGKNRQQLALMLTNTKKLAAKGDKGAARALATFRLVQKARKGDPKAKAAVALVAHRWEVGQRVRSRFELTAHGRIRARV